MQRNQFLIPYQLGSGVQRTISYSEIVPPFLEWYSKLRSPNSSRLMRQVLLKYPKLINLKASVSYIEALSPENIEKVFKRLSRKNGNRKLAPNSVKTYLSPLFFFRKKVMGKYGNPLKISSQKQDYLRAYSKKAKVNFGQGMGIDLAKISSLEVRLACILAYEENLTISEMIKLKKSSFRNEYIIATKKGRRRAVEYGPVLKMFLNNNQEQIFKKDGKVFTNNRGDVTVTALQQRVRKALLEIGMSHMNLRNMRKEGVIRFVEQIQAPHPHEIARNLGYRGSQSARRYIQANSLSEFQPSDKYDKINPDFGFMVGVLRRMIP